MIYQIKNGQKQFQSTIVFDDIDFNIKRGEKIALVGRNGTGKTTLMRIIANDISLDVGTVYKKSDFEVGYLSQSSVENEENTILEEVLLVFEKIKGVLKELDQITLKLEDDPHNEKLLRDYSRLFTHFELLGGYDYEHEMLQVLNSFGFSDDMLQQQVKDLSGGERTKVAFAKLLLRKPDLLLLDEPTNHLDLSTIEWLEGYLKQYAQALIIVSHDQQFLDTIVDKIWDIEFGSITPYVGNYSQYEVLKKVYLENQKKHFNEQQREIKRLEALIDKFRANPNKAAFAQSKIKYLERMDKIELDPVDTSVFKANFTSGIRGGNKVLEIKDLEIGYDEVLAKVSFEIYRGEKVAIIGDNGTGKSTLVKTIMNKIKPLSGEYLWGQSINVGYFDQQLAQVDSSKTVLEDIWDSYPALTQSEVRTLLGSFLFRADDVFKNVRVLSGGEKVRLSLLKVMLSKSNALVLDEPTNHLDIMSKQALAEAINAYDGTLLFVSHDRHFINKVASKIILLKDHEIIIYPGTYSEYKDKVIKAEENLMAEVIKPLDQKVVRKTYSNNWIQETERKIKQLEDLIEQLVESTYSEAVYDDYQQLELINIEIEDANDQLDQVSKEYLEYLETVS